jgi:hypothetical protein
MHICIMPGSSFRPPSFLLQGFLHGKTLNLLPFIFLFAECGSAAFLLLTYAFKSIPCGLRQHDALP